MSTSSSIVRITAGTDSRSRVLGTGFLFHQDVEAAYVLTCNHVATKIGDGNPIEVDGKEGLKVVSGYEQGLDVVVLKVPGLLNRAPFLLSSMGREGDEFVIKGFYEVDARTIVLREVQGVLGAPKASIRSEDGEDISIWDLHLGSGDTLQSGYSGAPVIRKHTGCVLGIVSHETAGNGKGLAISIASLAKIWPEIPDSLLHNLKISTLESDSEIDESKKMTDQDPYRELKLKLAQKDIESAKHQEEYLSEEIDAIIEELALLRGASDRLKVKRQKDQLEKQRSNIRAQLKELLDLQSKI
jgi:hypothetical protein